MKKVKITGKLNLDKMAIAKLNDSQTPNVVGGSTNFAMCKSLRKLGCIEPGRSLRRAASDMTC